VIRSGYHDVTFCSQETKEALVSRLSGVLIDRSSLDNSGTLMPSPLARIWSPMKRRWIDVCLMR